MHEYHFWLESDYGASFGMIEAQNEGSSTEFSRKIINTTLVRTVRLTARLLVMKNFWIGGIMPNHCYQTVEIEGPRDVVQYFCHSIVRERSVL